ncbi:putative reverse transcriptase domain, ribonuclease H-like domain, aspartic peptidase domain protein [Tanacetum coccineum]
MMSEDSSAAGTDNRPPMLEGHGVNNQRKVICYNCREEGHVARQCKEPKHPKDSLWHQDKAMLLQAKEKGAVLDAEAEAFLADVECTVPLAEPLALSTTNMFQEQSSSVADPLAYLAKITLQLVPTHFTTNSPSQLTPVLASTSSLPAQSHDAAMLATMQQIANLLSGFQKQSPPTNNQLRSSSNTRSQATVHDGQITTETVQRRAPGNVGNTGSRGNQNNGQGVNNQRKAMLLQAKEKGAVLDAEAEAFLADVECTVPLAEPLALSTTNMFQVSHEDAYDSDVIVLHDEHLDSDDDEVLEDYTILYDQYLATKDSQDVPTEASLDPPSAIPPFVAYMLNTLSELTTQVEGHHKVNQKQALVNATLTAELDRCKLELARLEHNKVKQVILARNKQNAKLKQETESLKTTLRNKEATIAHLTCETKIVLSEKKTNMCLITHTIFHLKRT